MEPVIERPALPANLPGLVQSLTAVCQQYGQRINRLLTGPVFPLTDEERLLGLTEADIDDDFPIGFPERYGAVGDGEADDTEAMQTCWNVASDKYEVVLGYGGHTYRITDQLQVPNGSFRCRGLFAHSYHVNFNRGRYHLICDIGDKPATAFIYASWSLVNKGTAIFDNINIDMRGSTCPAFQNETFNAGEAPRFLLHWVTIQDCGGDGIVINEGGNTSEITHCYISGPFQFLDANGEFDVTKYVEGTAAIRLLASDCRVVANEVVGGHWYGIYMNAPSGIVEGNFFDQCVHGGYFTQDNNRSRIMNNRFGLNMKTGAIIEASGISFIGNTIQHISSSRLASGTYDGVGIELKGDVNLIADNHIFYCGDGIDLVDASGNTLISNKGRSLSGNLYNYDSNVGTTRNIVFDAEEWSTIIGTERKAHFAISGTDALFTLNSALKVNDAITVKTADISLSADTSVSPSTGTYLRITPDQAGRAVTLTGYSSPKYVGASIVVQNASSDFSFTFDGTEVPAETAYQFIVDDENSAIRVQ